MSASAVPHAVAATPAPIGGHAAAAPNPDAPRPGNPPEITLDRALLRTQLAARRKLVFERFLAYREGRIYPINNLPGGGMRHVWIDDLGNLCAAATLISKDWGRVAAIRAGAANREIRLADVKIGPIADWMLTSGLAHHELVAIQLPGDFMDQQPREQEIARMYSIYTDVERQMRSLWEEGLDEATDALMKRPDLAREMIAGRSAEAPRYAHPPAR